jgi:hypothetical protein
LGDLTHLLLAGGIEDVDAAADHQDHLRLRLEGDDPDGGRLGLNLPGGGQGLDPDQAKYGDHHDDRQRRLGQVVEVGGVRKRSTTTTPAALWRTYIMLTDLEAVVRCLESDLGLRPISHHKTHRVRGHPLQPSTQVCPCKRSASPTPGTD